MQINITTDYAIRCVLYLAKNEGLRSSKEIGEAINVSRDFVQRIMQRLRGAGLVQNTMGAHGGYSLAKEPSAISVMEIFETMEDTMRVNRCMEKDHYCNINIASCKMHKFYEKVQEWMDECMTNTSIEDILNGDIYSVAEHAHVSNK